ncbi:MULTISPECIES: restriction endonuclease subunit S [Fusobacterium]|uniref:restriction endonuclease subunit S n=1 Tax=Fusobacterium TaxID=848 RepID=UPI001F4602E6|nr:MULTISPECIES: restriction endonuclease subunit S [Fusobacterium]MCF2612538.1 restriction endonuclease subunit S [Fusobacterium perfoetens]MDY2980075.1 restriction endonuclease subunit S [Fusobacterium sp.]
MPKKKGKEEQTLDEKLKMAIVPKEEEPYKVPDNWVWTRLGNIAEKISKGTTPRGGGQAYTDKGVKFLRVENISDDYRIDTSNIKYITEEIHNGFLKRSILEENDLLISIAGSLGKTAIVLKENLPLNTNQAIAFVRLINKEKYISKYFAYFFNSNIVKKSLLSQTKVTAIPNLTLEIINNTKIALPPIDEQKRIVNKLDYFFEKIQKVKEIIEEVKEKNEARKESILSKAFTGELTEKWRADNIHSAKELLSKINDEKLSNWEQECQKAEAEGRKKPTKPKLKSIDEMIVPNDEIPYEIPNNWVWTRLGDIAEINMGQSPEGSTVSLNKENGIGLIGGASDMGEVFPSITRYTTKPTKLSTKDDIIISVRATLGKPIFSDGIYCLGRGVCGIKSNIYLKEMIRNYFNLIEEQLYKLGTGSTFSQISREIISNLMIALPPIEEQKEIVRILDNIFTKENLINELISLEDKIQALEKSILDKAFRGELGTNSSDDIEAMELLKEILQK